MWPKTSHLLPVWPRDNKILDTPGIGVLPKEWLALQEIQNTNMRTLKEKFVISQSIEEAIDMTDTRALTKGTQVIMGEL